MLLEARNLGMRFSRQVRALDDVSFSVEGGEILALLGDNGAGKSTLVKILSGYFSPTEGDLFWDGRKIAWSGRAGPKQARSLGIQTVYQHLGLVEDLSAARNFFLGNEITRRFVISMLSENRMNDIASEQLAGMAVKRRIDPREPVSGLSGGERQALAICRARYFNSRLLLLDEPTSALSIRQREEVLQQIKQAAASGIAVILITHSLEDLGTLVHRYLVMYRGRLVADSPSGEMEGNRLKELIVNGGKIR